MNPRVLLIGTVETKKLELAYLAAALKKRDVDVDLMDVSLASNGAIWSGAEKLERMAERAQSAAAEVAAHSDDFHAAIGVGGGTGGEIVLAAMKGLPSTYPKILITTLAFDPRPALADSFVTIIPTLCDIEGLNTQLRQVFENAAASISGLTKANKVKSSGRPNIAITTLGATGRAGSEIARWLDTTGYEATVFHANGYGGAAFARFIDEGHAAGVVDLNVHELGRIRLAGAHVDMPKRFSAARNLPTVALPGALNFIGLGTVDTISQPHLARPHYRHTAQFTHVKLTAEEMVSQATAWAEYLNAHTGPCTVILPMGGFSHEDRPGGAIEDVSLREIAADILVKNARAYSVKTLPDHINSNEVAHAAVTTLHTSMI